MTMDSIGSQVRLVIKLTKEMSSEIIRTEAFNIISMKYQNMFKIYMDV